ncbi:MAG: HEAT repeat domain-containing protein [Deltaproteobacteria bacterium]|nr:HEAT repeat domain-containing protein [Deltaproteobacteria bacterium]
MALAAERARSQWETAPEFATRWRLLSPMAGDAQGRAALGELLAGRGPGASDADLRSEAARALGRFPDATDALRGGLGDAVPRVRAASATALRGRAAAVEALRTVLADDGWPTVRAAAAAALARGPRRRTLASALDARSVLVVRAQRALSENPATTVTARLVASAQDGSRASLLRRGAIDAVATRCDAGALAGLEALAETLGDTALPAYEQDLGHAALAAMAHIDAGRARAFLQRSEANRRRGRGAAVERAAGRGAGGSRRWSRWGRARRPRLPVDAAAPGQVRCSDDPSTIARMVAPRPPGRGLRPDAPPLTPRSRTPPSPTTPPPPSMSPPSIPLRRRRRPRRLHGLPRRPRRHPAAVDVPIIPETAGPPPRLRVHRARRPRPPSPRRRSPPLPRNHRLRPRAPRSPPTAWAPT